MLRGLIVDYGGVLTDTGNGDPAGGEQPLVAALRTARSRGVRTALLSNADTLGAASGLAGLFDAVVLSGQVGFGKPDPRIFLLAARQLGLDPADCVFVDDLSVNVRAAAGVGMVGVHHRSVEETLNELDVLLE
ncbi:HAD-IA family hydrolase [Gandjariella thermophila]|uniref:Haloacid dehalogenase n=1 Tax=Gandjariella thermophila TaxID=1931992 RepID=A0A4D4J712_9PSEU|nr:HAD-IA family hydrolase [Gandjariella thermophila]GDY31284.1 haloacid dehalogenase [Gandjariella thermophila]